MSDNPWDSVTVIRKRPQNAAATKSAAAVNAARRAGAPVTTTKKTTVNRNTAGLDAGRAARLDNETETFNVERVSKSVSTAIQKGRQAKNLTQKDLAVKINQKPQVVNDFESGKAIPDQQVLGKMERILGIKLRGADIGQPLTFGKKK